MGDTHIDRPKFSVDFSRSAENFASYFENQTSQKKTETKFMPFRKLYTKVRDSHLIFSLAANINTYAFDPLAKLGYFVS